MLSYSMPFSDYRFSSDARNRQTQAFVGAIGTRWLINGLGQRVARYAAGAPQFYFVYDEAGHQTGKYDGLGNPLWETAWLGDLPVAVLEPAGNFFIAPDHLGSPHQITDASGSSETPVAITALTPGRCGRRPPWQSGCSDRRRAHADRIRSPFRDCRIFHKPSRGLPRLRHSCCRR
jgi:hypothetical protein